MNSYSEALMPLLQAVGQLFLIASIGGLMVRRKWVSSAQVDGLSYFTVYLFLPALIFSKNIRQFDPEALPFWWMIPIGTFLIITTGVLLTRTLFYKNKDRNILAAIASLQNAAYLLLPIGQVAYPEQFDEFVFYVFLVVLGTSPTLWSLGKVLVTSGTEKISLKSFITPPFLANVTSLLLVLLGMRQLVPDTLLGTFEMIGQATVPAANLVLGAMIGGISLRALPKLTELLGVSTVKYIAIPLLVWSILYYSGLYLTHPLLCEVLVLESAAAPATNLMIQVRTYGGNAQKVGSIMLIMYTLCLFFIPFWILAWRYFLTTI